MTRNIPFAPRSASPLTRFARTEAGSATVEFVIVFPIIILMLLMGFEASYYMLRTVMLDRATDLAARHVRLADGAVEDLASLKQEICAATLIIPDCTELLQVELRTIPVVSGGTGVLDDRPRCVDVFDTGSAANDVFLTGAGNQLMALRVCAISDPLFPTSVLASRLAVDAAGNYAVITRSSWVNEPEDSTGGAPEGDVDSIYEDEPPP
ncbi:MAG: pilus assembly protein, partial [Maritimibacter sp.]|nr:pilus assembly protein [Maritimibacter sp.]